MSGFLQTGDIPPARAGQFGSCNPLSVLVLWLLVAAPSCGRRYERPASEAARIRLNVRPDREDRSIIHRFEMKLNGKPVVDATVAIATGDRLHFQGLVQRKPDLVKAGDSSALIIAYQLIGGASQHLTEGGAEQQPAEWPMECRQGIEKKVVTTWLNRDARSDLRPGQYDLRFYLVTKNDFDAGALPEVRWIGSGRLVAAAKVN